ncbi:MAG: ferritin family protein [Azonexus sp.]|jgi:rubrerythrin|nr:ferritin family protein [Azonexus sp.]
MSEKPIPNRSLEELFEFARTMELEAARRYTQLSDMMAQHNNSELTDLFKRMADIEWLHVYNVEKARRELDVMEGTPSSYPGFGLNAPEVPDFLSMHYLLRPYHALKLAMQHEERAAIFYTELADSTENDEVRAVALRFAEEEKNHVRELQQWLARYPEPEPGWDDDPDPPNELE